MMLNGESLLQVKYIPMVLEQKINLGYPKLLAIIDTKAIFMGGGLGVQIPPDIVENICLYIYY